MKETMLEKRGLISRKNIFTILLALTLILSFFGTTCTDPSDDDSRVKDDKPVVKVKSNP